MSKNNKVITVTCMPLNNFSLNQRLVAPEINHIYVDCINSFIGTLVTLGTRHSNMRNSYDVLVSYKNNTKAFYYWLTYT